MSSLVRKVGFFLFFYPIFCRVFIKVEAQTQTQIQYQTKNSVVSLDRQSSLRLRLARIQSSSELTVFDSCEVSQCVYKYKIKMKSVNNIKKWYFFDLKKKSQTEIKTDKIFLSGTKIIFNQKEFPKEIEIALDENNDPSIVSSLNFDQYLRGVLLAEVSAKWPLEALKAQAVASRSYAWFKLYESKQTEFILESNVFHQAYSFKSDEEWKDKKWESLVKAVRLTDGIVLVNSDSKLEPAYFHADCGGSTERSYLVWGGDRHLKPIVRDPSCLLQPKWTYVINRKHLREQVAAHLDLIDLPNIFGIQVAGRSPSGRVKDIVLHMGSHKHVRVSADKFRKMLGFSKVKSTQFELKLTPEELEITGKGFGHGVGMCQNGARIRAKNGADFKFILKLYYPETKLSRVDQMNIFTRKITYHSN